LADHEWWRNLNTLTFEKLSRLDRPAEPASVSILFARGHLLNPEQLIIRGPQPPGNAVAGEILPLQRRVLARWADGSVQWLLVHFQPDLPDNLGQAFTLSGERLSSASSPVELEVEEAGPLRAVVLGFLDWFEYPYKLLFWAFFDKTPKNQRRRRYATHDGWFPMGA
jgi:hypothetical protein